MLYRLACYGAKGEAIGHGRDEKNKLQFNELMGDSRLCRTKQVAERRSTTPTLNFPHLLLLARSIPSMALR